LLEGIRTGVTPSPSFDDGVRAQAVLDAVSESAARRTWVEIT
jgi:predicted dehydrogenase